MIKLLTTKQKETICSNKKTSHSNPLFEGVIPLGQLARGGSVCEVYGCQPFEDVREPLKGHKSLNLQTPTDALFGEQSRRHDERPFLELLTEMSVIFFIVF